MYFSVRGKARKNKLSLRTWGQRMVRSECCFEVALFFANSTTSAWKVTTTSLLNQASHTTAILVFFIWGEIVTDRPLWARESYLLRRWLALMRVKHCAGTPVTATGDYSVQCLLAALYPVIRRYVHMKWKGSEAVFFEKKEEVYTVVSYSDDDISFSHNIHLFWKK